MLLCLILAMPGNGYQKRVEEQYAPVASQYMNSKASEANSDLTTHEQELENFPISYLPSLNDVIYSEEPENAHHADHTNAAENFENEHVNSHEPAMPASHNSGDLEYTQGFDDDIYSEEPENAHHADYTNEVKSHDHEDFNSHEDIHTEEPENSYHAGHTYEAESFENKHDNARESASHNSDDFDDNQEFDEHHEIDPEIKKAEEEDTIPECMFDCQFPEPDSAEEGYLCAWLETELKEDESCFNDCSPGVIYYAGEKMCQAQELNGEETHEDPMACIRDCPTEDLNPHSADSFCPWFSIEKSNMCFHDCSDDFLNMAQEHAQHICSQYPQMEQYNFINYESLAPCQAGFWKNVDICEVCPAAHYSSVGYECTHCPDGMTSFPGAESYEACYYRLPLFIDDSHNEPSHESEDSYNADMPSEDSFSEYEIEDSFDKPTNGSAGTGELEAPASSEYSKTSLDMETPIHN